MYIPSPTAISYSHAVSRSSELLSCAKTALKVAKAQHANDLPSAITHWYHDLEPHQLRLAEDTLPTTTVVVLCQDALSLLRAMQQQLTKLQSLVRRRGHTNDPTQHISLATQQLEQDVKELSEIITTLQTTRTQTAQHQRHLQLVGGWLQTAASQQTAALKQILQLRGTVLAEQAQRRKLLQPQSTNATSKGSGSLHHPSARLSSRPHAAAMNSPLFTMTPQKNSPAQVSMTQNRQGSNPQAQTKSTGMIQPAIHGPAGYGGGYGGYGGGYGATTGIRQRHSAGASTSTTSSMQADNNTLQVQSQIQERQTQRETQHRLEQAKQAESTLAELGTLFGKMTNLISAQGEQLEKLEDDVEAAMGDVIAGQEEIQTLYSIKKGNRSLIIKIFGILIFFILFMRLY